MDAKLLEFVGLLRQNGVRVSTTVTTREGDRAIGTVVSDPVRARTLEAGAAFRGQAFVVREDLATGYDPLTDPEGTVVGMLFVGTSLAPYEAAKSSSTNARDAAPSGLSWAISLAT
mgnify:CR=1 FL=1